MSYQARNTLPVKRRLDLDSVESPCPSPVSNGENAKKPSGSGPLLTRSLRLECDEIYEPTVTKNPRLDIEAKKSFGHATLARFLRSDLSVAEFKATLTEEEEEAVDFVVEPFKNILGTTTSTPAKASPAKTRLPLAVTTTSNCFAEVFDGPASPLVPSLLLQTPRKAGSGSDRSNPIVISDSPIVRRPSPPRCSSPDFPETMHCRKTYGSHVGSSPKSPEYDPISPKAFPDSPDFVPPSPSYKLKPDGNKCFAPVHVVPDTPREDQESPSSDETVHVDFGQVLEPPKIRGKPKLTVIIPVFKGEPLRLITPIKGIVPTFKGEAPRLLPVKSIKPIFKGDVSQLTETPANPRRSSRWAGGAPRKPKRFL